MEYWSNGIMRIKGSLTKIIVINIFSALLAIHSSMAAEKLTVYVVNYPLQYFAERIGGGHVKVVFPAPFAPITPIISPAPQSM